MGFVDHVHAFVLTIPHGRITTYGDVALAVGRPGAARAVGRIMTLTPDDRPTPCHRVVRSDGYVVAGPQAADLASRLRQEGVAVDADGRIPEFAALRWPQERNYSPRHVRNRRA